MRDTNFFFVTTAVLLLFSFLVHENPKSSYVAYGKMGKDAEVRTVIFTGDIMLAREVERIMEMTNALYPFRGVADTISRADLAVGNFEASVPEVHQETPDFGFHFSAKRETLEVLRDVGFDYLSLANNHSMDFGNEGYVHTKKMCVRTELICGGVPRDVSAVSRSVLRIGDVRLGILALDTTSISLDEERIRAELLLLEEESDMQVAYIHWGEEYMKMHNVTQEHLAHFMIDHGIDAVIGHHPHVVQDVAVYKDAPIFYSLGNLVFDQYFDTDVQTGLMVQLAITTDTLRYTLIPVSSIETPSQPQLMGFDAKEAFLASLSIPSSLIFARGGLAQRTIISTMEGHK